MSQVKTAKTDPADVARAVTSGTGAATGAYVGGHILSEIARRNVADIRAQRMAKAVNFAMSPALIAAGGLGMASKGLLGIFPLFMGVNTLVSSFRPVRHPYGITTSGWEKAIKAGKHVSKLAPAIGAGAALLALMKAAHED